MEKNKEQNKQVQGSRFKLLWYLIFVLVVGLWVLCGWLVTTQLTEANTDASAWQIRGQFGDMFGAVNALFSGLAFGAIVITLVMQRQDMALQEQAIIDSQQQLIVQNTAIEKQHREIRLQNINAKRLRFERMFFDMISIHFEIVSRLDMGYDNITGVKVFTEILSGYQSQIYQLQDGIEYNSTRYDDFKQAFSSIEMLHLPLLSSYFQSLIAIYSILKQRKLKAKAEQRYLSILHNYISLDERKFLFYYNILSDASKPVNERIRGIDRELNLMDTVPANILLDSSHAGLKHDYTLRSFN
ncbi:MAG TPA: hypothetical protein VD927_11335 [Chryseosolibacter sp.]|nr:hypothetical protein [Chryseosolibacter sp.]